MKRTPSLLVLPGPLWPRMIVPVRVLSMSQIEHCNYLLYMSNQLVPSIAMLYQYFNLGIQLKSFKYCYLTLIILFNITHSFAHNQIVPIIAMYH